MNAVTFLTTTTYFYSVSVKMCLHACILGAADVLRGGKGGDQGWAGGDAQCPKESQRRHAPVHAGR